jgi:hypothetical protein
MIGSAPATFMMSSGTHYPVSTRQQDEYTVAAVFRQAVAQSTKPEAWKEEGLTGMFR